MVDVSGILGTEIGFVAREQLGRVCVCDATTLDFGTINVSV